MAAASQSLKFSRASRIKQSRDFSRVRREGRRLVTGCLIANWRRLPEGSSTRLGVVTAGNVGNAVARGRTRRLLREAFRVHQHDFVQPVDLVLVARPTAARKKRGDVEKDLLTLLRRAQLLKE